jgi:hypothetical protein
MHITHRLYLASTDFGQRIIWKEAHRILREHGGGWRATKRVIERIKEVNEIVRQYRNPPPLHERYRYC